MSPPAVIFGGFCVVLLVGGAYGFSYDIRDWLDERAWRRVERRIAERLGVAPPPASVHLDRLQREGTEHRKELALRALREHEADEEARIAARVAEEILEIQGLTHFDARDWR